MFECSQCSKAYKHESGLFRHRRIHSRNTPDYIHSRGRTTGSEIYDDVDFDRIGVADDQSEQAATYDNDTNNMNHMDVNLYNARKAIQKKVLALNRSRDAENEIQIDESMHESGIIKDSAENEPDVKNVLPVYVHHDGINAAIKPLQECLSNLLKNDVIMMESLTTIIKEVRTEDGNDRDVINQRDAVELDVEGGPIKYVFWHDINTLIDRLCFLHTRKQNGGNEHMNEIVAIERALRDEKIIQ